MKVPGIAETIGISKECVVYILHEELQEELFCRSYEEPLLGPDKSAGASLD
jgi:hypothetical protein